MRTQLIVLFIFCLGAMSVGAQEAAEESSAAISAATPSTEGASLSFGSPQDGDVVPTTFTVKFLISGMGIAAAGSNIENTGHHHLLIDLDELPPMDLPLPKTDQLHHFGSGQAETELTLPEGEHTLQLLFADYMHRPHNPPVISDKITITVSSGAAAMQQE